MNETCFLVKEGYDLFLKTCDQEKDFEEKGNLIIREFWNKAKRWYQDGDESLFETEFLTNGLNDWARAGMAKVAQPMFVQFMNDSTTRSKLKEWIEIRLNKENNSEIVRKIASIDLWEHLQDFKDSSEGFMPRILFRRMYTIMFYNLNTTIADEESLKKTAEALNIAGISQLTYERLQISVKSATNRCLRELGLIENMTPFAKCVIPWFVYEIVSKASPTY